ncbi:hypothetical protein SNE40_003893 [Patella caerulea]|uniref:Uncharacterized protein n=1 Tax=Patella caerulea TaxID=87958 RepID=A0AAN8Q1B5_PATCE
MADAILKLAMPSSGDTPKSNRKDDNGKSPTSEPASKKLKASGSRAKSSKTPTNKNKSQETNEVGADKSATTDESDNIAVLTLLELKKLCNSIDGMKTSVEGSFSRLEENLEETRSRNNINVEDYEYDSEDSAFGRLDSRKVKVTNTGCFDPARNIDHLLSDDSDDENVQRTNDKQNSDTEFDALSSLKSTLTLEEVVGNKVDEKLAVIVTGAFSFANKQDADVISDKLKKYKRPENCDSLKTQEISKLMWDSVSSDCRSQDCKLQKIQTAVVKASTAVTECLDLLLKSKKEVPKEISKTLTEKLGDSIALSAHACREIILRRKAMIQPHLKEEFKPLCAPSAAVSHDDLFGEDLAKAMKDMSVASKLSNKMGRKKSSYGQNFRHNPYRQPPAYSRNSGYNNTSYNNTGSGYRQNRDKSFLYKGHNTNSKPPEKRGGWKRQK